ncbi:polysaccharide lyase family 14 protein [Rhizoctonia solani AG-1 IB]|uniref:Polysaccharide lyase family 14 protein n=1 Tax=Thanatephorus cucumeris (strain AG1-IB / isolate 7/3/14) TaxID=1108050 RepID=M5BP37_THACB|nr:polysaccharide lyase family 14 protein [Rhizoctonia solani AG-1 IB]
MYITATAIPLTRTVLDTTTITRAVVATALPTSPSPIQASASTPTDNTWRVPSDFKSLDCFNILKYGFGKSNLKVVQGIPRSASLAANVPTPTGYLEWNNEMYALEVFFPEGSINPGNSPQGGADFYASPLPALAEAQNVTFAYSVFLPVDFEPVRGGKLPGLYGGKTGCSGGDAALDCFSTRLMWRANSEGELYLYAPKDKQTYEVCNTPPRSICEADYGLSIGRGSFRFTPGRWTHVSQTVVLNTPGEQDGYFTLDVDGERIMDLNGLYYRQTGKEDWDDSGDGYDSEQTSNATADSNLEEELVSPDGGDVSGQDRVSLEDLGDGGLLGHILVAPPKVVGQRGAKRLWSAPGRTPVFLVHKPGLHLSSRSRNIRPLPPNLRHVPVVTKAVRPTAVTVISQVTKVDVTAIAQAPTTRVTGRPEVVNLAAARKVPGFSGIFFSTFFGGHTPNFATPKDQRIWFKDFSLIVND